MSQKTSLALCVCLASMLVLSGVAHALPDGYEPDDSPMAATVITLGPSPNHSIFPASDEDWFTFTLTSSAAIILETSGPTGDTVMALYESDGTTLITSNDDGGTGTFSKITRSLGPGTYYVRVTSFSTEIDDYSLTYSLAEAIGDAHEPDDSPAVATSIAAPSTSKGHSIFPAGDEDWWVFTLSTVATVVLETSGDTGDTFMDLYRSDGATVIASNDDGGTGLFSRTSQSLGEGRYYVRVAGYSSSTIADYELSLTLPTGTPAGGLSPIVGILIIVLIAVVIVVVVVVVLLSRSKQPLPPLPPSPGPMPGQPGQPWQAMALPPPMPPSPEQMMDYTRVQQVSRGRAAGSMLAVGAMFHFLAVPITLVLLKVAVESEAGRSITWDDLWYALNVTGFMGLIVLGIGAQIILGIAAVRGSLFAFRARSGISVPLIICGVIGMAFSLIVFGGIVGLIGGVLTAAGGALAKTAGPTMSIPPPYRPPMPTPAGVYAAPQQYPPAPSGVPAPPPPPGAKTCWNCNALLPPGATTCEKCGSFV